MKRTRWAAVLFALLLFCCGIALGVLADRYYNTETVSAKAPAESWRERFMSHMRSRLNLTDGQVAQLNNVLDQTKARYRAVHEKNRPELRQIREEEVESIKSILTARQVPIYEQMVKEHEQHKKEGKHHDHH